AHATLPELIDDTILAQHKATVPACEQHLRLEFGEQATFDQRAGDNASPVRFRQFAQHRLDVFTADKAALTQVLQKRLPIHLGRGSHIHRLSRAGKVDSFRHPWGTSSRLNSISLKENVSFTAACADSLH